MKLITKAEMKTRWQFVIISILCMMVIVSLFLCPIAKSGEYTCDETPFFGGENVGTYNRTYTELLRYSDFKGLIVGAFAVIMISVIILAWIKRGELAVIRSCLSSAGLIIYIIGGIVGSKTFYYFDSYIRKVPAANNKEYRYTIYRDFYSFSIGFYIICFLLFSIAILSWASYLSKRSRIKEIENVSPETSSTSATNGLEK